MENPLASCPASLGKYKIVRELGKGAMGLVYEAIDPALERRVALKTIRKDLLQASGQDMAKLLQRFRREALASARLQHPNIVVVHDYAEADDVVFIAMELVRGRELKAYFAQKRRFDGKTALHIMLQLLDGLAYSHRHNIVHRDIKPANIFLVEGSGQVKITDFGIARIDGSELTLAGDMMGTPAYMAPEQFRGQTVDGRADLFSAGVVLYELLTGERPFAGGTVTALMHSVLSMEPPLPSQRNSALPPLFDQVLTKALAKEPGQRYQTAEEFKTALKAVKAALGQAAPAQNSFRGGILGDLKKEADLARQAKEAEEARLARLDAIYREALCPRLLEIHRYLYELLEQLNTLSWKVQAEYQIPVIGKVVDLFQEGYRVHIDNMDTPKRVVLTFACRVPDERRYSVEVGKADEVHQFFVSQQTKYMDWPVRGPTGQINEIIYQARLQVMVALMFQADIAKSRIVVGVSNMEGIASQRHEYRPEEIDEEWLDRLGNYILRKIDTIAKQYITEEERQALRAKLAVEKECLRQEDALPSAEADKAKETQPAGLLRGLQKKLFTPGPSQ
jgi:tRNA A-37 threonylcarbamoyl transferase component Bud32